MTLQRSGSSITSQGIKEAERDLKGLEQQGEKTERKASDLGKARGVALGVALGVAIAGGAALAAKGLQVYVRNSIQAEKVQAQLAARIKSTGAAAGLAIGDLNKMADALQKATTFDDEAIGEAQGLLLTFTKIGRDVFPRATEAVLDMSTALGGDLKGAALQVGKALNDPVLGVTALARAGVQFSEAQKETIKKLVETNHLADAQAIVLKELETQMGGSARAARDTLGGALAALGNSFDNLLEGDAGSSGGVRGTREAIESLTNTLNDPDIKRGVDSTASGLLTIANAAIQLIAKLGEAGSALAEFFADNEEKSNNSLINKRTELETQFFRSQRSAQGGFGNLLIGTGLVADPNDVQARINEIDKILSDRSRRSMFEGVSVRVDSTALGGAAAAGSGGEDKKNRTKATKELTAAEKAYQEVMEVNAIIDEQSADAVRELFFARQGAAEALADEAARRDANNRSLIADMQFERDLLKLSNVDRAKAIALRQLEADATEKQKNAVAGLAGELERSRDQVALMDGFRFSLSDTFADIVTGSKSAKDGLKGLFDSLFDQAARAVSDQAIQQLFGSFGSTGGGKAGGNWFGELAASIFGGGRAIGGPVSAGRMYEVGERGPEILQMAGMNYLIPPAAGKVTPVAAASRPAAPSQVNVHYTVAGSIDRRSADQIAQDTGRKLRTASVRG